MSNKKKPFSWKRLKNQIMNLLGNPFNMMVFISLLCLFFLIVVPLLQIVANTFTLARSELRRVDGNVGDFTLYYWKYVLVGKLSGTTFWAPLKNSLIIAFFVVIISVPLGSILAWLMVRSDLPGKKFLTFFYRNFTLFYGAHDPCFYGSN